MEDVHAGLAGSSAGGRFSFLFGINADEVVADFYRLSRSPLEGAGDLLRAAVDEMGGRRFLEAIDRRIGDEEEEICGRFDDVLEGLVADEIVDWTLIQLARTAPGLAHARIELGLRTFPVGEADEDDYVDGQVTLVPAFLRVVLEPEIVADRYDLECSGLGQWIMRDAVVFVDEDELS